MSVEKIIPYNSYRRAEEKLIAGPPVDLSYHSAASCSELSKKSPQSIRTRRLPTKSTNNLYVSNSMWLSHNCLTSLNDLDILTKATMLNPSLLSWLDISFNELTDIDISATQFPNLKIIYLHANKISNMQSILKLQHFKQLRTLTLHENPVSSNPDFRAFVVTVLPQLLNLDFSRIINIERKKALPKGFFQIINKTD